MDDISRSLWLLISCFLVFLMIPSLGLIGSGCMRKKNAISQLSGSFLLFVHGFLFFGLIGYGLFFGSEFFLFQNLNMLPPQGVTHSVLFIFHALFFSLSLIILQGVWGERMRLQQVLLFSLLWGGIVYLPIGWLLWAKESPIQNWKILDFAGGLVVHVLTGFSALAMTILGGRRRDYFNLKFKFNNSSIALGGFLLLLGWLGFNGGSSIILNRSSLLAILNTVCSSTVSCVVWYWNDKFHTPHRTTLKSFVLGLICGLVAITPGSGYLTPAASLILGLFVGFVGYYGMRLMNKVFKQDDVLEVFSTHGLTGIFGSLALIFFLQNNLINSLQQILVTISIGLYGFAMTFLLIKIIGIKRLLIPEDLEEIGLDQIDYGESVLNLD